MSGRSVDPRKVEKYRKLRKQGYQMASAAREAGIGYATVRRMENGWADGWKAPTGKPAIAPVHMDKLKPEAVQALEDFGYFQRRYLGRVASPWQEEVAYKIVELLASPDKEYVVLNAPPGSGKSTLMTLDIPAWVIARNRGIRGATFSNTQNAANRYVQRLKRFLERTHPIKADPILLQKGLELDALATVADDFGTFRPSQRENWSREEFVVAQLENIPIDEKESTWTAFGFDSQYIGMRLDFLVADDVVDKRSVRTLEAVEKMRSDWNDVAERRLDPGGLLVLQGQRLGAYDLYKYCASKPGYVEEEDDEEAPDNDDIPRMYHHMVYKAHYDDRCAGTRAGHRMDAPGYPQGCLLEPRRIKYGEVMTARRQDATTYSVVFQQEDMDPRDVLVKPIWVTGGTDPDTGEMVPGCWDKGRDLCELPTGLAGDLLSYATCDPSAARFWCQQWWVTRVVDGVPQERYLMDLNRAKMMAPDLLDWHNATQQFGGLMEEWQERSVRLGLPITRWIIERNGAQRYLLQYESTRRWAAQHRVEIVPHDTNANKLDPDRGVETLRDVWHWGMVRLPAKGNSIQRSAAAGGTGWMASAKLVEEVTHYPDWPTTDCVMAQWFGEYWLPRMCERGGNLPNLNRPDWLKGTKTYVWARSALSRV
jgi:hypothetical protein